jgi:pimeloyl-ACP methyl ester carboxylesterase
MQAALDVAGFATLNLGYESRRKPLETLADDIHPAITRFAGATPGLLHFVGHSMGGLVARAYLARYPTSRMGRVVMLGTPNGGSQIADRLGHLALYRAYFGPAGQQLGTRRDAATQAVLPPVTYPVGIIAGNRSIDPISSVFLLPGPNDGRVTVEDTKLDGMTDHIVIGTAHAFLPTDSRAIALTIAFLRNGQFA